MKEKSKDKVCENCGNCKGYFDDCLVSCLKNGITLFHSDCEDFILASETSHPNRYGGDSTYECIKVLKEWMSTDEYRGFCRGNAIKYLCRLGKKDDPKKELDKAKTYIEFLKESYPE